jgi:hypothetical protein
MADAGARDLPALPGRRTAGAGGEQGADATAGTERELAEAVTASARQRFGRGDALLASVFMADALRAGGARPDELGLLVLELELPPEAGREGAAHHNALRFRGWILDAVLPLWLAGAPSVYPIGAPPEGYRGLSEHPIYRT